MAMLSWLRAGTVFLPTETPSAGHLPNFYFKVTFEL